MKAPMLPLRSTPARLLPSLLVLLTLLAMLVVPGVSEAGSYKGWGDTGWNFDNKRDCCEEAVWLAQEDSIRQCENAGGRAKVRSGSTRGLCDWDAEGGSFDRVYRCTANSEVYCR